jgi:hypothetical protein
MEEHKLKRATRRRLLKRASVLAAGVAGAGVASTVMAPAAQAADGDPVTVGGNLSGASTTRLTISPADADAAPLRLTNTAGPGLTIDPVASIGAGNLASPVGSIIMDQWGDLTTVAQPPGAAGKRFNFLYSPAWAAMPVVVTPARVLDTRFPEGQVFIVPGSGNFSGGFITPKGTSEADLAIDLSPLLNEGYVAVQAIISILGSPGDGWLTIWGDGPWPGAVSVNFLGGRVVGGLAQSELTGVFQDSTETFGHLKIKLTHRAAVTIDVCGFITPDPFALFADNAVNQLGARSAAGAVAQAVQKRVPKIPQRNQ